MSLRLRVALLTALAVVVVEVAIVASIYAFASYRLYAKVESDLRDRAATLRPVVAASGGLPPLPTTQDPGRPPFLPRVIAGDGRVLSSRSTVDLPVSGSARAVAAGDLSSWIEILRVGTDSYDVLTVGVGEGRALQVAHSLAAEEEVLGQVLLASIALAVVGLIAAPLAGAAVATAALAPLRRLSRVAQRVTQTGDPTERVGMSGGDELALFAKSFDAMLDRLNTSVKEVERAQRAQRQLVADASHELRAPLATLRANVALLGLGDEAPIGDREQLIVDTLAGIEDLTTLVGQLIDLAREDDRVHERAPVQLDQLVFEEIDRARQRYPKVEFQADLDPTVVSGDTQALGRAVANLVDNAGKWSPPGATVRVRLHDATLEVTDEGPGIDASDLPHIFERFYRGAQAREIPGSGLGLAIVAQVMRTHGGEVSAQPAEGGGTIFRARFLPVSP